MPCNFAEGQPLGFWWLAANPLSLYFLQLPFPFCYVHSAQYLSQNNKAFCGGWWLQYHALIGTTEVKRRQFCLVFTSFSEADRMLSQAPYLQRFPYQKLPLKGC
ncbi:hypothetical protein V6N13_143855 [Hibiscus sabdariffa]|uniref:Uncharacterized protein n=1 Tax=Hibiscus sabdariffa TaxID=183260 RepID=A0ABR2FIP1_9ROSI